MRPILAVVIAFVILGGLQFYMRSRPVPQNVLPPPKVLAEGKFDVELTLTFDAVPDPFAFDPTKASSVVVMFEGQDLIRLSDNVVSGVPLLVEDVASIAAGRNEFFVEVIPKNAFELKTRGLRIRVFRDGVVLGEKSLWSEPGSSVAGAIVVDTPNAKGDSEGDAVVSDHLDEDESS